MTPTVFRKSSASYLASQNVSQAHLEDHHGWTRGSKIAARYIAVFDDANEREIARARGAENLYVVVSQSGRQYLVDIEEHACECDDSFYRHPDGGCKHVRRVQFATARRDIPQWANADAIDPDLGAHVDDVDIDRGEGLATDGGVDTEMVEYTREELAAYTENFATADATISGITEWEAAPDGAVAVVETDDDLLRDELEGAQFRTVRVGDNPDGFFVLALSDRLEWSYTDSSGDTQVGSEPRPEMEVDR